MKIAAIEITSLTGRWDGPSMAIMRHKSRAMPADIYKSREDRAALREARGKPASADAEELYLTIRTDAGVAGFFGPIDRSAALVIKDYLAGSLIGEDPLAGALLWDKMARANKHSRSGFFMIGISAIDNALWDLRGKAFGVPVYRLLGGGTRTVLDAYASTIGYDHERGALEEAALALREEGYRRQKWFMSHGPADGADGLQHNVALVRNLREVLGDAAEIMFDASLAWDLTYTVQWADRVREYRPTWIEEPFSPDKTGAWAHLARRIGIPLAGGEHLYTSWEVLHYLQAEALSILQPDPEWCGGITALVKMCALGELFDIPVIPHGHGLRAALHVIASQSPATCPWAEFVQRSMLRRYHFEADPPFPKGGQFHLSDRPGFGILIDDAKVLERSTWTS